MSNLSLDRYGIKALDDAIRFTDFANLILTLDFADHDRRDGEDPGPGLGEDFQQRAVLELPDDTRMNANLIEPLRE